MKDFVPFELAYELKELGFDEECLGFYDAYNGDSHLFLHDRYKPLWLVRTWRRLFSKSSEETTFVSQFYVEYIGGVCLAPTFSQAFRFLREKHLLVVSQDRDGGWWIFNIKTVEDEDNEGCKKVKDGHIIKDEYEEAELACLKKLIEIVKTR